MVPAWMQNSIARVSAMVQQLTPALAQDGGLPIKGLLFQVDAVRAAAADKGIFPDVARTDSRTQGGSHMPKQKAILVDIKRCVGCLGCETACKQIHGFSTDPEPTLSDTAFTVVETRGDKFVRKICMHCEDPACASACPVGAIKKTALGPVVYDADKCIGCRYCMLACPYQVPRYQWTKLAPFVKKCDMCSDRVSKGRRQPACTEACPVQASVFGDRDELIAEAWSRIRSDSSPMCRGSTEWRKLGGGSVLFVSDVPFEKLGFKPAAYRQPADADADRRAPGRFAQGRDHGRHDSVGPVLDHAAPPRSRTGRSRREVRHQPSQGGKELVMIARIKFTNYPLARHRSHHLCYRPLCDVRAFLRGFQSQHQSERSDALGAVGRPRHALRQSDCRPPASGSAPPSTCSAWSATAPFSARPS